MYGAPYLHGRPGACTRVRARSTTLASAPLQAPALRGRTPVVAVVMLVACHWMIFFVSRACTNDKRASVFLLTRAREMHLHTSDARI
jgi:hypothetical protein